MEVDPSESITCLLTHYCMQDTPFARSVSNPSWLKAVGECTVNNPDYHRLEQSAALGIGNARSLAKLFSLVSAFILLFLSLSIM